MYKRRIPSKQISMNVPPTRALPVLDLINAFLCNCDLGYTGPFYDTRKPSYSVMETSVCLT